MLLLQRRQFDIGISTLDLEVSVTNYSDRKHIYHFFAYKGGFGFSNDVLEFKSIFTLTGLFI